MKTIDCGEKYKCKKIVKKVSIGCFVSYLFYLIYLVLLSHTYGRGYAHRSYNFIPFETIFLFVNSSLSFKVILINVVGNIVAFLPMGFLIPIISEEFASFKKILLVSFLATLAIEVSQYIIGVGVFDIDDLMLNTLGGILGYLIYRVFIKVIKGIPVYKPICNMLFVRLEGDINE